VPKLERVVAGSELDIERVLELCRVLEEGGAKAQDSSIAVERRFSFGGKL